MMPFDTLPSTTRNARQALDTVNVCETFTSIQGESTYAGLTCFFIRLAECNLRCRYCDTTYAYEPGEPIAIDLIVAKAKESGTAITEITGGEPLLQDGAIPLAQSLCDFTGGPVLVETNGSKDISVIPNGVITIMDIKCPASGQSQAMDMENIGRLRAQDEVKFVISDRSDYDWARELIAREDLASKCHAVLLSPVYGRLEPAELAGWVLKDKLSARVQVQMHKEMKVR